MTNQKELAGEKREKRKTLDENERKVLDVLCETSPDYGVLSFDTIAHDAGLRRDQVVAACRSLRTKNLTEFVNASWDADGKPCGAGYAATHAGRTALKDSST
jgi:DNA-binding MurR/RpiR family transcriptional regulator